MKYLIPRKNKKIRVDYPENVGPVSIIYIRYHKGVCVYVGETVNYFSGRHLRPNCCEHLKNRDLDFINNNFNPYLSPEKKEWWRHQVVWDHTDFIRILNAPANVRHRQKWEAKLVCWLNPKLQKPIKYIIKADLDPKAECNQSILMKINGNRLVRKIEDFSNSIMKEIKDYRRFQRLICNTLEPGGFRNTNAKQIAKNKSEITVNRAFRSLERMGEYKKDFLLKNIVSSRVKDKVNYIHQLVYNKMKRLNL